MKRNKYKIVAIIGTILMLLGSTFCVGANGYMTAEEINASIQKN